MRWQSSGVKIRYGKYKLEPVEQNCFEAQELLRKIGKLTINPAEVAHFDGEFKKLIKLIEDMKKP